LVSPDNRHVAYPVLHRGQWTVSLDGVESPSYRKVTGLVFSPDSRRLAYVAEKAPGREAVVVDGQESTEFGSVDAESLRFSPDSRHLALVAGPPDSLKVFIVLDGKPGPAYDVLCGTAPSRTLLFFSSDNQRLAYAAGNKSGGTNATFSVLVQGDERWSYSTKNVPTVQGFSPQSQRLAWIEDTGSKRLLVVDGKVSKEFDEFGRDTFRFSPDGKRMAYFAKFGLQWSAVLDERRGPAFDSLGDTPPVFSADGQRLGYIAIRAGDYMVVVDDKEGSPYDSVGRNSIRFSPDGQHLAYTAQRGPKRFVVRDRVEGRGYDGLREAIFFSPDSRHLAYVAEREGRSFFVLDDKEGKEYEAMANDWACFSPDSKRLAYGAASGGRLVLVVSEEEIATYEGNLGTLAFEGTSRIVGVASRTDEKFNPEVVRFETDLAPR
jgi:hypothetical protein